MEKRTIISMSCFIAFLGILLCYTERCDAAEIIGIKDAVETENPTSDEITFGNKLKVATDESDLEQLHRSKRGVKRRRSICCRYCRLHSCAQLSSRRWYERYFCVKCHMKVCYYHIFARSRVC